MQRNDHTIDGRPRFGAVPVQVDRVRRPPPPAAVPRFVREAPRTTLGCRMVAKRDLCEKNLRKGVLLLGDNHRIDVIAVESGKVVQFHLGRSRLPYLTGG